MERTALITRLQSHIRTEVESYLSHRPLVEVASLDEMEALSRSLFARLVVVFFEVWSVVLERVAKDLALTCPCCGGRRKCKRRRGALMKLKVLGLELAVPKLYLECGHCAAPGLSVTKVLTGLGVDLPVRIIDKKTQEILGMMTEPKGMNQAKVSSSP